ncbi:MAG: RDD family protein [Acidimicrobiaceae bacterium]|nr:RDD family protein [Acidimicrobiaceae bacterium]MCY4175595.1 RDD family protein [Acidimicrobiaceae bacterium]MCY4280806.1 RDD family protein [Acidimicrobiaceae bacterium]MCY4295002.1 RDD family protein [Acidimicrobiaceae bacterium]
MGSAAGTPSGAATLDTGETLQLANLGRRLLAKLIDFVIIVIALGFIGNALIALLVLPAYEIVFTKIKGQTPGKMILRIKVVRADSGYLPDWGPAAARGAIPAVGLFLAFVPGLLVYASPLWNKRKQGWHDMAAKTLVVKASNA